MSQKQCSKCRETKPLSDFNKNKSRPDGYAHYCKPCAMGRSRQWVESNRDTVRAAKRKYYWKNPEKERETARTNRREKPEANNRHNRTYNKVHPGRMKAVNTVNRAVARGDLLPVCEKSCVSCGKQAQDYHHHSYEPEFWLDVIPLCKSCHRLVHTGTLRIEGV